MDKTKKPLAVMTMVYEDYDFLKRWYDYYAGQVEAENLFVFSHGNDSEHKNIAKGANVLNVPRDPEMLKFDKRRWRMLGDFASGLLNFYNWALVTDVDEMVVVDPDISVSLIDYLENMYPDISKAPRNISPLGLNLIHIPEEEPLPILENELILSRRRFFHPSRVYSKPTLVRLPVSFAPGGHRNNLGLRTLSDDLYLVHLKFFDMKEAIERSKKQAALIEVNTTTGSEDHVWLKSLDAYQVVRDTYSIGPEDISLPEIRAAMMKQKQKFKESYIWGQFENRTLFQLPTRFSSLF